jgi:adenylosuccinate synthase
MPGAVVLGTQWGDEGKAKIIDYLSERSDVVIRYQGGANAGHTVVVDHEKFVFHMVPSGIKHPGKICVIGNGVVFDIEQFFSEVNELLAKNVAIEGRLFVSDLAHLVLPYHKAFDRAKESHMADTKIGTTGRGIGPAYSDKALRIGLRVGDLLDFDLFAKKFTANFNEKKMIIETLYKQPFDCNHDEIIEKYRTLGNRLKPFIADTAHLLFTFARKKKKLLFEGAQGTFLDIDHGTYPFVTSSNTVSGAAAAGAGVGPNLVDQVIGLVKAYTTRVGNGPFPTELSDSTGEHIREKGGEYGATTGRPRRCGWLDTTMIRKAAELNGLTRLALTKLDVLSELDEIHICTHYELSGNRLESFPSDPRILEKVKPVCETMPGWKSDLVGCKKYDDLPANARKYIKKLQKLSYGIPLLLVSVGPDRTQTIEIEKI